MPPIQLPVRMYAGGEIIYNKPMLIGEEIKKVSTIDSIKNKVGSTGNLTFLRINHKFSNKDGLFINEYQNLVYREDKMNKKLSSIQV
ncbi:MaoC family dehydratase N-terminal domain-containing protein [Alphaproteobacteria bacterium]|nr:MaoC family dehydratase N-terminal domain-containing protein [Alphaproteobacteria bacterium]